MWGLEGGWAVLPMGLALVGCYLLGSVSGSLWLGRLRGVDIRTQGSGNAGGTNAFRTQGLWFALGTVLIDIGKGAAAVALVQAMGGGTLAAMAALLLAVLGHVWPIFHGFRGGKGAATLVGGLLILWPMALLPLIGTWLLVLALSGYVGLATVLAGVALPLWSLWAGRDLLWLAFSLIVAVLLAYTHRGNLQRLRAGTESRFERVRVFARLGRRGGA